jgi:GntR family transcriptional regulator
MITAENFLDRSETSVPLYAQIAESLLNLIESGELSTGDRLPSERELSDKLRVNRLTLRRALNVLENQGLIVRRRGSGTYVAEPKIEWQAGRLIPFTSGAQRRGYVPGARVILFEQHPAETAVAAELKLPVSALVYYVHRLRFVGQEPVLLERLTLPTDCFPGLEQFNLAQRSLYEVFETEYGITVSRARQSLEPVVATEYEAELLNIRPGAPLMMERRLTTDRMGRPIEYGKDLYRGDRFRFVTEIAPLE